MRFIGLLDKTATVTRLVAVGDKESYGAVGSFLCHLQQLSPEETAFAEGVYGKTFSMYCKLGSDVNVSDNVSIGGVDYKVKAKKTVDFKRMQHLELILVLPDD